MNTGRQKARTTLHISLNMKRGKQLHHRVTYAHSLSMRRGKQLHHRVTYAHSLNMKRGKQLHHRVTYAHSLNMKRGKQLHHRQWILAGRRLGQHCTLVLTWKEGNNCIIEVYVRTYVHVPSSGSPESLADTHSALAAVSNQQRAPQEIFHSSAY